MRERLLLAPPSREIVVKQTGRIIGATEFSKCSLDQELVTEYSYKMDKAEELLEAARNNPGGLSFGGFEHLMELKGWILKRQRGSHRLWRSPAGHLLPVQTRGNKAKDYQVRQFVKQLDAEAGEKK